MPLVPCDKSKLLVLDSLNLLCILNSSLTREEPIYTVLCVDEIDHLSRGNPKHLIQPRHVACIACHEGSFEERSGDTVLVR